MSCSKAGFTLLEVLVVMVIIGIILTFTTLSIGDGGREAQLKQEAQRLAALLSLAQEQAVFQAQEWGLAVYPDHYQFYLWQPQGWQLVTTETIFKPRFIPKGMALEVQLEGRPLLLGEKSESNPQILLLSSGELTPFEVTFRHETDTQLTYQLRGNLLGELALQRGPE